jgi:GH15 family glucan-1,4-alpha-glucosidase
MELVIRCEYGSIIPWVRRLDDGRLTAVAGPDRLTLSTPAEIHGENLRTIAEFEVKAGEEVPFSLTWSPSYRSLPAAADAHDTIEEATAGWLRWSRSHKAGGGEWSEAVLRSLITLKALTHVETGGIVAAATTSLPEQLGGPRNWDYRFCWLRDATLTLYALMNSGFFEEAAAWRDWLLRAVAGAPPQMQIMYGIAGERRLIEYQVPWLKGYEGAAPVRIGTTPLRDLDVASPPRLWGAGDAAKLYLAARRAGSATPVRPSLRLAIQPVDTPVRTHRWICPSLALACFSPLALPAQLLHASADGREIVGSSGSADVPIVLA